MSYTNGTLNGHDVLQNPAIPTSVDWATIEEWGDLHVDTSIDTPMRDDAFEQTDGEKIAIIEKHFRQIMNTLGLDLTDDSLNGTPHRVAKMFVKEIFSGLNPANKPKMTVFDNKFGYDQILVEKNITLHSTCEHHFLPITGKAHVAYIPNGKVIGLSKLNRIVQYFGKRPQVQERLNMQIFSELCDALGTPDVAVIIDAEHACVSTRGVHDIGSSTVTAKYGGKFNDPKVREELWKMIG